MSTSNCFQTLDVARLSDSLDEICEAVGSGYGRVEITREGCDDVCVLISKCELDSLERALEILSEGSEFQAMCDEIAQVAAATSVVSATPASASAA